MRLCQLVVHGSFWSVVLMQDPGSMLMGLHRDTLDEQLHAYSKRIEP